MYVCIVHNRGQWGNTALTFAASRNFSAVMALLADKTSSGGLSSANKVGASCVCM